MSDIVITGLGVLSPGGDNLTDFWNTLKDGKVTYSDILEYKDRSDFRIHIGARIQNQEWKYKVPDRIISKYGLTSQYAVYATLSAISDAGIRVNALNDIRTALVFGTTMGEVNIEEKISEIECTHGTDSIDPILLSQYKSENIIHAIQDVSGVKGPSFITPVACSSGNYAIALGKMLLENDLADIAIVGGVDVFSRVAFVGFQRLLSLSPDLCRPFCKKRNGLVIGEGAGVMILEKKDKKTSVNKNCYGKIIGVGLASDGYNMTTPHPEGNGLKRAMELAFANTNLEINKESIDYISAHGTGTYQNDKVEALALSEVFREVKIPATSSIKSVLGHSMGAASALELIASCLMMKFSYILPTVNFTEKDENFDVDCVPNIGRSMGIDRILSNSNAFGGCVSSLIIEKDS